MSITRTARRCALTALVALGVAGSGSITSAQAAPTCGPAADVAPTSANVIDVERAMQCLVNEYRGAGRTTNTFVGGRWVTTTTPFLTYNRALQVVAEQNAQVIALRGRLPARSAQDRANDLGYRMGNRCRTNDYRNWVKAGSDWEADDTNGTDGWEDDSLDVRNTARVAVAEIMKQIGPFVRDASRFVNVGTGVVPTGAAGNPGASFSVVVGQCRQG